MSLLGVACYVFTYGVVWFDRVSFTVYSELAKIKKGKRVWVFLTRFQNVAEVRKFIQCEVRKFTIPL